MRHTLKFIQKKTYTFLSTPWGVALCVVGSFWCLNTIILLAHTLAETGGVLNSRDCSYCAANDYADNLLEKSFEQNLCLPPIDIVYTWVNGSDPKLHQDLEFYKKLDAHIYDYGEEEEEAQQQQQQQQSQATNQDNASPNQQSEEDPSPFLDDTADGEQGNGTVVGNTTTESGGTSEGGSPGDEESTKGDTVQKDGARYRDNQELRYSLRSLWKFAPWVRNVYIVTNGQVPHWLRLDHPRLKVIPHSQIYKNQSHLPTFASPSIESNLINIPGISDHFIYFNDDVMLGNEVWPDDFYSNSQGQKVFLSWVIPPCSPGCSDQWIGDKFCDSACNNAKCGWDGGDCNGTTTTNNNNNNNNNNGNSFSNWQANRPPTSVKSNRYCHYGCPNTWVGDQVCDVACNVVQCGFDGGDCGMEKIREELYGSTLDWTEEVDQDTLLMKDPEKGMQITLPKEAKAFYVDLGSIFDTVEEAEHDNSLLVRSAIISTSSRTLSVLLYLPEDMEDLTGYEPQVTFKVQGMLLVQLTGKGEGEAEGEEGEGGEGEGEATGTATEGEGEGQATGTATEGEGESEATGTAAEGEGESEATGTAAEGEGESEATGTAEDHMFTYVFTVNLPLREGWNITTVEEESAEGSGENAENGENGESSGSLLSLLNAQATSSEEGESVSEAVGAEDTTQGEEGQAVKGPRDLYPVRHDDSYFYIEEREDDQVGTHPSNPIDSDDDNTNESEAGEGPNSAESGNIREFSTTSMSNSKDVIEGADVNRYVEAVYEEPNDEGVNRSHNRHLLETTDTDPVSSIHLARLRQTEADRGVENEKEKEPVHIQVMDADKIDEEEVSQQIQMLKERELQSLISEDIQQLYEEAAEEKRKELKAEAARAGRPDDVRDVFPWEVKLEANEKVMARLGVTADTVKDESVLGNRGQRRLMDAFGESLIFVNRLLSEHFGREVRKVPAHMPHYIDVNIMKDLHAMWPAEFEATSSHRFRHNNDMQFAFSYFYFMMNQRMTFDLHETFTNTLDTDQNGVLGLPEVEYLSYYINGNDGTVMDWLRNCTVEYCDVHVPTVLGSDGEASSLNETEKMEIPYPDCPITEQFIRNCSRVYKKLGEKVRSTPKNKHVIDKNAKIEFYMVQDIPPEDLKHKLSTIRLQAPKFICLNDDMNKTHDPDPRLLSTLHEFYESYLPLPCPFELPVEEYRTLFHLDAIEMENMKYMLVESMVISVCLLTIIYALYTYLTRKKTRKLISLNRFDDDYNTNHHA